MCASSLLSCCLIEVYADKKMKNGVPFHTCCSFFLLLRMIRENKEKATSRRQLNEKKTPHVRKFEH